MTTATRVRPVDALVDAPDPLTRRFREARHGLLGTRVELEDAAEAGEVEHAAHVGLYAGEAEVAAAPPRLLDRLEQSPQPRARDVVHAAEVGDDADAAFADALAERGNEGRRRRAVDAARDDHDLHGAAFDDPRSGSSVTSCSSS